MLISRRHLIVLLAAAPAAGEARAIRKRHPVAQPDPRELSIAPGITVHTIWREHARVWRAANYVVADMPGGAIVVAPVPHPKAPTHSTTGWWRASLDASPASPADLSGRLVRLGEDEVLSAGEGELRIAADGTLGFAAPGQRGWIIPRVGVPVRARGRRQLSAPRVG